MLYLFCDFYHYHLNALFLDVDDNGFEDLSFYLALLMFEFLFFPLLLMVVYVLYQILMLMMMIEFDDLMVEMLVLWEGKFFSFGFQNS